MHSTDLIRPPAMAPPSAPATPARARLAARALELADANVALAQLYTTKPRPSTLRCREASTALRASWEAFNDELDVVVGVETGGDSEETTRARAAELRSRRGLQEAMRSRTAMSED